MAPSSRLEEFRNFLTLKIEKRKFQTSKKNSIFKNLLKFFFVKSKNTIQVVEEPYTIREARLHVRHVRDLIKSLDASDAMNGLNGASISYLNTITEGDIDPANEADFKEPKHVAKGAQPQFKPLFPDKNPKDSTCIKVKRF